MPNRSLSMPQLESRDIFVTSYISYIVVDVIKIVFVRNPFSRVISIVMLTTKIDGPFLNYGFGTC
jgi:hypothetical protein